jgi:DNA-binding PadR family transcriptional regulator
MYTDILILAHLVQQPYHGYELKRQVESVGGNLNNNQLYPKLRQFEEMGAITREVERQAGRPDRHIYRLTDLGIEVLQTMLQDFPPDLAGNDGEFLTRVAFFHLIEPDARRVILLTRQEALQRRMQQHRQYQALVESEANSSPTHYPLSVLALQQQQLQLELDWIATLLEEVHR